MTRPASKPRAERRRRRHLRGPQADEEVRSGDVCRNGRDLTSVRRSGAGPEVVVHGGPGAFAPCSGRTPRKNEPSACAFADPRRSVSGTALTLQARSTR